MVVMLSQAIHVLWGIFGILLLFFIPGYLLVKLFFNKTKDLEALGQIGLGIAFSICIAIVVGLLLGFVKYISPAFSGLTMLNLLISLVSISAVSVVIILFNKKWKS